MEPLFAAEEDHVEHDAVFRTNNDEREDYVSSKEVCKWDKLTREALQHYAERGPAALLGDLDVRRYPEFRDDGFIGWLVEDVDDPCLKHVLKKNDVLVSVNGVTLNTPSDLWNLWRDILSFDEIRLVILRKSSRLGLVFKIE